MRVHAECAVNCQRMRMNLRINVRIKIEEINDTRMEVAFTGNDADEGRQWPPESNQETVHITSHSFNGTSQQQNRAMKKIHVWRATLRD